jgi:large subunit ribosomal protein L31
MKQNIHPDYQTIKATCACGETKEIRSTLKKDLHLDVCGSCHPFYTGKQKVATSGGRVDRFNQRFAMMGKK